MAALFVIGQNRYQVVITEIMADPSPTVGLPNNEWIELKNTGNTAINLAGWRLGDLTSTSGPMPNFVLEPDSYVIVCTGSAVAALSLFGAVISVTSFPSLDNDGDQLFLRAVNGTVIHAVNYQNSWYNNDLKKEGGWTLEMIDPLQPCAGKENWNASNHQNGGTPGVVNSINGTLNSITGLTAIHAYANSSNVTIVFNQPVDSSSGATIGNYSIPNNSVTQAITLAPLFNQVQLTLAQPLTEQSLHSVTINNITNCKGQIMSSQQIKTGMSSVCNPADVIINEILFRPRPNGYDYVEIYNNSQKNIDLSKLSLSNRNTSGSIANIKTISNATLLLYPGEFVVLTENADNLGLNYLVKHPDKVVVLSSLPSYPNTSGNIVLLNDQGEIVDELAYTNKWHFPLIDNDEGISLERIDPDQPTQNSSNWHSAASTAGYGTPTYQNSQHKLSENAKGNIVIMPKVFSPDGDGFDDIVSIHYTLPEPGFVANITIFDAAGRIVKNLVRNGTTSTSGYWNWNGLDDKNKALPIGTYVVFSEFFTLQGKKHSYKNTVVLARRL